MSTPPSTQPSPRDRFLAANETPILMTAFAAQVAHFYYINHTQAATASIAARPFIPRHLRAGLGWGALCLAILSQTTAAKKAVHDHSDPSAENFGAIIMSADFWAGYISGAAGIIIGNPLDLIKVRLQAGTSMIASSPSSYTRQFESSSALIRGATAPILGYGALNALLFVTYNRTSALFNGGATTNSDLWTTWLAGAVGGLATWVVSTPTELVKCRAQISTTPISSLKITRDILRTEGLHGLYFGGTVTALRDSIGYGFYFWSYELGTRLLASRTGSTSSPQFEAAKVLLCGGVAGIVTWASVFPLDVIKTRVQTQLFHGPQGMPLLQSEISERDMRRSRMGAVAVSRKIYAEEGLGVFFRGLGVCSIRAFIVNAAQWAVYEWIMRKLRPAQTPNIIDS